MRMRASLISLQSKYELKLWNEGVAEQGGGGGGQGTGHVTPSFLTDDKTELQSNFNLQVNLV